MRTFVEKYGLTEAEINAGAEDPPVDNNEKHDENGNENNNEETDEDEEEN